MNNQRTNDAYWKKHTLSVLFKQHFEIESVSEALSGTVRLFNLKHINSLKYMELEKWQNNLHLNFRIVFVAYIYWSVFINCRFGEIS